MSYFMFNGISSQVFGILERCPLPPRAELQYESISIPGRDESIEKLKTIRKDMTIELTLGLKDLGQLPQCYQWLSGTGDLILSTRPHEKYRVKKIKVSPEYVSRKFGKLKIKMTVSPYSYSVSNPLTDVTACKKAAKLSNHGSSQARPLVKFKLVPKPDAILMGDVNFDGRVTAEDAVMLQAAVTANDFTGWTKEQLAAADMDGNGVIDISDVSLILIKAAESGVFDEDETPYDVYLHFGDRVMRVSAPAICAEQGFWVTVDCENEIVYYTDADGNQINILHRTYGELPYMDPGGDLFWYTGDVQQMLIRKNERW